VISYIFFVLDFYIIRILHFGLFYFILKQYNLHINALKNEKKTVIKINHWDIKVSKVEKLYYGHNLKCISFKN